AASTSLTVTQLSSFKPPPWASFIGPVYRFGPTGTQFASPVSLSLPMPSGATTADMVAFTATDNGGAFGTISASTVGSDVHLLATHFSAFSLMQLHPNDFLPDIKLIWQEIAMSKEDKFLEEHLGKTPPPPDTCPCIASLIVVP